MTRVSPKKFQPAMIVVEYIEEERERCKWLVEQFAAEPEFLLFCIEKAVDKTDDLDQYRQEFTELQDLM